MGFEILHGGLVVGDDGVALGLLEEGDGVDVGQFGLEAVLEERLVAFLAEGCEDVGELVRVHGLQGGLEERAQAGRAMVAGFCFWVLASRMRERWNLTNWDSVRSSAAARALRRSRSSWGSRRVSEVISSVIGVLLRCLTR